MAYSYVSNSMHGIMDVLSRHYSLEGYRTQLTMDFMMGSYIIKLLKDGEHYIKIVEVPHFFKEYTLDSVNDILQKGIKEYEDYILTDDYLIYKFTNGFKHDEDRLKKLIKTNPELLF